jgi:hypothetical protein
MSDSMIELNSETLNQIKRDKDGMVNMIFIHSGDFELNKFSLTPNSACAIVEDNNNRLIVIKESQSKSRRYAEQDIGCTLHSPAFKQHYEVSNRQYNELFGENKWTKKWMKNEEFYALSSNKILIVEKNAKKRQQESWSSTGHRK